MKVSGYNYISNDQQLIMTNRGLCAMKKKSEDKVELPMNVAGVFMYVTNRLSGKPIKITNCKLGRRTVRLNETVRFVCTKKGWKGVKVNNA